MPDCTVHRLAARIGTWFDRIDPGTHRRIKGLRLVTAFGLAAMLATMPEIADRHGTVLSALAAGFALWASVSEARTTRYESARDLVLLCLAAGAGAASFTIAAAQLGPDWAELTLVSGSFCVGYFKRFGVLGSGIGSQIFIGQLLAYSAGVTLSDLATIALAVALAMLASVVPRVLSGEIMFEFVDLLAVLLDSDRVRRVSFWPFLVRNWCGPGRHQIPSLRCASAIG